MATVYERYYPLHGFIWRTITATIVLTVKKLHKKTCLSKIQTHSIAHFMSARAATWKKSRALNINTKKWPPDTHTLPQRRHDPLFGASH